ncbi:MAG TPA: L,D-transpeptidase family protein [Gaiellaceae bacterium]|jgi:lipoprotein-anchoring transpeptidase ErfK/SrfK|nr:L,D-transpeptidase family protein [Gaiellaceae bacterium]
MVLKAFVAIVAAAGLAAAASPAAQRTHTIPAGVTVGGLKLGGMSAVPARDAIAAAYTRPISVVYGNREETIEPSDLNARVDLDAAVTAALDTTRRSIPVNVTYSRARARQVVDALAKRFNVAPTAARVVGATAAGPQYVEAKNGRAVETRTMTAAIAQLLSDGTREPLQLVTKPVVATKTVANFGPAIVITRATNTLRLYDGRTLVRTFAVATGQAIYPTPAGLWDIVNMQRDPWWYPPVQDEWAKGLKPVPPGPSNPLGTRWMGLNAPGVGIHGTDAPSSIGYSASHGCVRMQVPDAEWLFEHVHVGTPVVIL